MITVFVAFALAVFYGVALAHDDLRRALREWRPALFFAALITGAMAAAFWVGGEACYPP